VQTAKGKEDVKRYGYLFERVCDFRALTTAAIEAARGKKKKARVAMFLQNLETEVIALEKEVREKNYQPRPYHTFMGRIGVENRCQSLNCE